MQPRAGILRLDNSATGGTRAAPAQPAARARRAFSLAELMIALAVLGMGLLVIGAALPVGVRYTRQTVDLATGDAAAQYALDLIAQNTAIPRQLLDDSVTPTVLRTETGIFVPRDPDGAWNGGPTLAGEFVPEYEPVFTVRPLGTQNIFAHPQNASFAEQLTQTGTQYLPSEALIATWLGGVLTPDTLEYDSGSSSVVGGPWLRPSLPCVALFYPPIMSEEFRDPNSFYDAPYTRRPVLTPSWWGTETLKALRERNVTWTGFYRRVSYAPDADPFLYEFIVVAMRVPENARFPVQNSNKIALPGSQYNTLTRMMLMWADTGAPVPWLASLKWDRLPPLPRFDQNSPDRPITQPFSAPATLQFVVPEPVGMLLPRGSVMIPAINNRAPNALNGTTPPANPDIVAGFVPAAPDILPIYEVVDRAAQPAGNNVNYVLTVTYNGFFPYLGNAQTWPVWIVPPPYTDFDSTGDPLLPDKSPILSVARRYVRLRELP